MASAACYRLIPYAIIIAIKIEHISQNNYFCYDIFFSNIYLYFIIFTFLSFLEAYVVRLQIILIDFVMNIFHMVKFYQMEFLFFFFWLNMGTICLVPWSDWGVNMVLLVKLIRGKSQQRKVSLYSRYVLCSLCT